MADNTVAPIIIGVVDNASAALGAVGSAFAAFAGVVSGGIGIVASFSAVLAPLYYGVGLAKDAFGALSSVISTVVSAFSMVVDAAVSLGQALFDMTQKASQSILNIKELSTVVGMQPQQFQAWAEAAAQVGISQDSLGMSMRILSQHIEQANLGNAASVALFQKLGIAFEDTDRNIRGTSDVLKDVSDKLGGMGTGAEATGLAVQVLGRAGATMLPIFQQGAGVLDTASARVAALGETLTEASIKGAEQFRSAWVALTEVVGAFAQKLGADLMPAFTLLMNQLADLGLSIFKAADISGLGKSISDTILGLIASIPWGQLATDGAAAVNVIISAAKTLFIDVYTFLTSIPWGEVYAGAKSLWSSLVELILKAPDYIASAVSSAMGFISGALNGIINLLKPIITAVGAIETVGQLVITAIGMIWTGIGMFFTFVHDQWRAGMAAAGAAINYFLDMVGSAGNKLMSVFGFGGDAFTSMIAKTAAFFNDNVNHSDDNLNSAIDEGIAKAGTWISGLGDKFKVMTDNNVSGVLDGLTNIQAGIDPVTGQITTASQRAADLANSLLSGAGAAGGITTSVDGTNAALQTAIDKAKQLELAITTGQNAPPAGASPGGGGGYGGGGGGLTGSPALPTGGSGGAGLGAGGGGGAQPGGGSGTVLGGPPGTRTFIPDPSTPGGGHWVNGDGGFGPTFGDPTFGPSKNFFGDDSGGAASGGPIASGGPVLKGGPALPTEDPSDPLGYGTPMGPGTATYDSGGRNAPQGPGGYGKGSGTNTQDQIDYLNGAPSGKTGDPLSVIMSSPTGENIGAGLLGGASGGGDGGMFAMAAGALQSAAAALSGSATALDGSAGSIAGAGGGGYGGGGGAAPPPGYGPNPPEQAPVQWPVSGIGGTVPGGGTIDGGGGGVYAPQPTTGPTYGANPPWQAPVQAPVQQPITNPYQPDPYQPDPPVADQPPDAGGYGYTPPPDQWSGDGSGGGGGDVYLDMVKVGSVMRSSAETGGFTLPGNVIQDG